MGTRPKTNPVDWHAIRLDYESGTKTTELMARHRVTDASIRSHARREGWTRPEPDWRAIRAGWEAGERVTVRAEGPKSRKVGKPPDYRVLTVAQWVAELRATGTP